MDSEGQTWFVQFAQRAVSLAEPFHQPSFLRQALLFRPGTYEGG